MTAAKSLMQNGAKSARREAIRLRPRGRPSSRYNISNQEQATEWARRNLPDELLRLRVWTAAELRIVDVLLNRANDDGIIKIAGTHASALALVSEKAFFLCVERLEAEGVIEVRRCKAAWNRQDINEYHFPILTVTSRNKHKKANFKGSTKSKLKSRRKKNSQTTSISPSTVLNELTDTIEQDPISSRQGGNKNGNRSNWSNDQCPVLRSNLSADYEAIEDGASPETTELNQPAENACQEGNVVFEETADDGVKSAAENREYVEKALRILMPSLADRFQEDHNNLLDILEQIRQKWFSGLNRAYFEKQLSQNGLVAALSMISVALKIETLEPHDPDRPRQPVAYLVGVLKRGQTAKPHISINHSIFLVSASKIEAETKGTGAAFKSMLKEANQWLSRKSEDEKRRLFDRYRTGRLAGDKLSPDMECRHWRIRAYNDFKDGLIS
ncbi:hypothetical protein [Aestuariispira insulae]|nr:hypothetical protein [Aestuariispira insulae]